MAQRSPSRPPSWHFERSPPLAACGPARVDPPRQNCEAPLCVQEELTQRPGGAVPLPRLCAPSVLRRLCGSGETGAKVVATTAASQIQEGRAQRSAPGSHHNETSGASARARPHLRAAARGPRSGGIRREEEEGIVALCSRHSAWGARSRASLRRRSGSRTYRGRDRRPGQQLQQAVHAEAVHAGTWPQRALTVERRPTPHTSSSSVSRELDIYGKRRMPQQGHPPQLCEACARTATCSLEIVELPAWQRREMPLGMRARQLQCVLSWDRDGGIPTLLK